MGQITLKVKYDIQSDLVISVDELKSIYLFGLPLNNTNGVSISDDTIAFNIASAQEQMENFLCVKFKKQIYQEKLSFDAADFYNWSYLKATYMIVKPLLLEGYLNTTKQVSYPTDWLSVKQSSDGILFHRNLYIVPAGNSSALTQAQLFTGIIPNLTYLGLARIPNYWDLTYSTGWNKVPKNIIDAVGKLAALSIYRISGDLIVAPGIGSFSMSIDGLSQSKSIKSFDQRIQTMLQDLTQRILPELKNYYVGLTFTVC